MWFKVCTCPKKKSTPQSPPVPASEHGFHHHDGRRIVARGLRESEYPEIPLRRSSLPPSLRPRARSTPLKPPPQACSRSLRSYTGRFHENFEEDSFVPPHPFFLGTDDHINSSTTLVGSSESSRPASMLNGERYPGRLSERIILPLQPRALFPLMISPPLPPRPEWVMRSEAPRLELPEDLEDPLFTPAFLNENQILIDEEQSKVFMVDDLQVACPSDGSRSVNNQAMDPRASEVATLRRCQRQLTELTQNR
ncbi:hypothetical protein HD806DRAFT_269517 [Xylariaceae sp. AK1471]|nr:hypothetical protein HD806DRAFT_269517 [Xylariaceae sp. AK1471]